MANELSLLDAWRTKHPNGRDFTYYSSRHSSWSKMDTCWISIRLMQEVEEIDILPGSYADHKPPDT